ncbi:MAG TPA: DUF397 domain-containing protein [Streptosporangiaceae bacterium]|jgi:hypothetical protein
MTKPTVADLGVDPDAQEWARSGAGEDAIEVAFVREPALISGEWVLMRVAADPAGRVLVFDRHEWECFLDGARKGEFDVTAG